MPMLHSMTHDMGRPGSYRAHLSVIHQFTRKLMRAAEKRIGSAPGFEVFPGGKFLKFQSVFQ